MSTKDHVLSIVIGSVLAGCSHGPLDGTWFGWDRENPAAPQRCADTFSADANHGTYERGRVCTSTYDGRPQQVQSESGTLTVDDSGIRLTPVASTCSPVPPPAEIPYAWRDAALALPGHDGAIRLYVRTTGAGIGGQRGCWTTPDVFIPDEPLPR